MRDGIVVREEQSARYEASEDGVPDFNPRGCQKDACCTQVMHGPSRLTVPMKWVDERGSGQWQRISWEQTIKEIAEEMVSIVEKLMNPTVPQISDLHFLHEALFLVCIGDSSVGISDPVIITHCSSFREEIPGLPEWFDASGRARVQLQLTRAAHASNHT